MTHQLTHFLRPRAFAAAILALALMTVSAVSGALAGGELTLVCTGDTITCTKAEATTTVEASVTDGTTYEWSGDGLVGGQGTPAATWNTPGPKTVLVTNPNANPTSAVCTSYVAEDKNPPDGNAGYDKYLNCTIRWVDLKGSCNTPGATFWWTGPDGFTSDRAHPTLNQAGMYILTITGPNGCTTVDTANIIDLANPPVLSCQGDNLSCEKPTATTCVTSSITEGVTYIWSGDGLLGGQGTACATWSHSGPKKVVVIVEGTGCVDSCTAEVTVDGSRPVCGLTAPSPKPACGSSGNVLSSTGTGAASFAWSVTGTGWAITDGQGTSTVTYTAGASGTAGAFKLVITGQNGCKDSCEVTLTCEPQTTGGEGCTPGYWKNHTFQWNSAADVTSSCVASAIGAKAAAYATEPWSGNGTISSLYRTTFGLSSAQMTAVGLNPNMTLLTAINLGGGGFFRVARHSVAGLLSSCAVGYAFSAAQVLQMVHDAVLANEPVASGDLLSWANEQRCPLNNRELGSENIAGARALEAAPTSYNLSSNFPNPFNPSTLISFEVPEPSQVNLSVYNMLGQVVANLVDGIVEPGMQMVEWNANSNHGIVLPSGIYVYRMQALSLTSDKSYTTVRKMMLMK